jgi:hypothetical protein
MSPEIDDQTRSAPPHDLSTVSAGLPTPLADLLAPGPAGTPPSARVPGYEITSELGRGGMGVVYRALHLTLGRPVALKMVLGETDDSSPAALRFLAEAAAVAAVSHPHVVGVYDLLAAAEGGRAVRPEGGGGGDGEDRRGRRGGARGGGRPPRPEAGERAVRRQE